MGGFQYNVGKPVPECWIILDFLLQQERTQVSVVTILHLWRRTKLRSNHRHRHTSFYRPDDLPAAQHDQGTESIIVRRNWNRFWDTVFSNSCLNFVCTLSVSTAVCPLQGMSPKWPILCRGTLNSSIPHHTHFKVILPRCPPPVATTV